jgi:hypothetical protein
MHVSGFDMMLSYAVVEDSDWSRARRVLKALRRESLRRGAKLSAAKCLHELYGWGQRRDHLRIARKLAAEAPEPEAYYWLARSEARAGHETRARAAMRNMLRSATRVGDLDRVEMAKVMLSGAFDEEPRRWMDSFGEQMRKASIIVSHGGPYDPLTGLKASILRAGGRATAIECVRSLLSHAADRRDVPAGLGFARQLVTLVRSSYSYLALALAHERVGKADRARLGFAQALRHAVREGDIHRATKATAGLLRTKGTGLVSRSQLRWAMREALQEPDVVPDYRYLRAALGRPRATG